MPKNTHFVRRFIEHVQGAHAGITTSCEVLYIYFFICKALHSLIFEYFFYLGFFPGIQLYY